MSRSDSAVRGAVRQDLSDRLAHLLRRHPLRIEHPRNSSRLRSHGIGRLVGTKWHEYQWQPVLERADHRP